MSAGEALTKVHQVPGIQIHAATIGGVQIRGEAVLRPMLQGEAMQLMHLELKAGYLHPLHNHPDNESIGFVVSGRIEMTIGSETFVLGAGDAWRHPRGVYHSTRALCDSVAVELHAPRRQDYVEYFAAEGVGR